MQTKTLLFAFLAAATTSALSTPISARAAHASASEFGTCNPAMNFAFGRPGRKATEGTFLPTDPVIAKGQQDALNPNIITNAVCNQLINVCGVAKDSAGETACLAAKATVAALTTRDATTANAFNSALGVWRAGMDLDKEMEALVDGGKEMRYDNDWYWGPVRRHGYGRVSLPSS